MAYKLANGEIVPALEVLHIFCKEDMGEAAIKAILEKRTYIKQFDLGRGYGWEPPDSLWNLVDASDGRFLLLDTYLEY